MGQQKSLMDTVPDTIDVLQYEIMKHKKSLTEIKNLSYDELKKCLQELNDLSKKCIDSNGNQLIFAVKKGTDSPLFWKVTVRIACVKINSNSKQIVNYKLLNLKQFLQVFKTFETHLQVMLSSEKQRDDTSSPSAGKLSSSFLDGVQDLVQNAVDCNGQNSSYVEHGNECCICLDRKPDVLLPCAHIYCYPCIEQWNTNNKNCPICQESLPSTDETWVLSELPLIDEVNEEICSELMKLSKDNV